MTPLVDLFVVEVYGCVQNVCVCVYLDECEKTPLLVYIILVCVCVGGEGELMLC